MMQAPQYYFICTNPRSGSTLLAECLQVSGLAGQPREFFQHDKYSTWFPRFGADGFADYLPNVIEQTSTPNGVFGAKIMAYHFGRFQQQLHGLPAYAQVPQRELMHAVFPGARYIWLTRRDKVRQAISYLNAVDTGVWNSRHLQDGPRGKAHYSFERVNCVLRNLVCDDAAWQGFFDAAGIEPLTLVYEDFIRNRAGSLQRVFDSLGIEGAPGGLADASVTSQPMTAPDAAAWRTDFLRTSAQRWTEFTHVPPLP